MDDTCCLSLWFSDSTVLPVLRKLCILTGLSCAGSLCKSFPDFAHAEIREKTQFQRIQKFQVFGCVTVFKILSCSDFYCTCYFVALIVL